MPADEVAKKKADTDILMCSKYIAFVQRYARKPQIIKVSEDILEILVPKNENPEIAYTFFEAIVVIDKTLPKNSMVCGWLH